MSQYGIYIVSDMENYAARMLLLIGFTKDDNWLSDNSSCGGALFLDKCYEGLRSAGDIETVV